ncbi:invasin domain 3-containing protein [Enterobacter hormaechei]
MKKIPFALGRAADVAAQEPKAEQLYANSARGQAVFAGLVVAKRGKPFTVLSINGDNFLSKLGDPIHPRLSDQFEPIRHVAQAVNGGRGYVVRVVPPDMQIPILRFKETTTPPAPTTTPVAAALSSLTTNSSTLRANGTDTLTLAFTARGADGSLLTGLKNVRFTAIGKYPPTFGDVYEINGTYYVDMTATRSDSQIVLVLDGNTRLGQFSVTIQIDPAIVDASQSSIKTDKAVIDNDGKDKATITFTAMDQDGKPVIGMDNIDFMVQGSANVIMDKVVEVTPGVYQTKISGYRPGTMTVRPRQDGKNLAPLGADVQLVDVITGAAIDDALSNFDILPQDIYNDGLDSSLLTFTAHDAKGRLIKGISDLTLNVAGLANFTQPVFTETSSGVYQARLYATSTGTAEITPMEGTRAITTMKKNIDVLKTVPIDQGNTTITQTKRRMLNDGKDYVSVTLTVKDAQGNPIKGPPGITFREDNGNAKISAMSEITPGVLTVTLTSDYTGTLDVKPYQYGQPLGTYNAQMISAGTPVLTLSNCKIDADIDTIQANGTDAITVTFEAKDQMKEPMSGLGISFVTNDIPSGIRIIPQVETNGLYSAVITGTEIHSGKVTLVYQGRALGTFSRPVNILAVHGKIDWARSSFDLDSSSVKANDRDIITATATLIDGYDAPVLGYTKLGNQAADLLSVNMSAIVEQGNGVYTFEITSLSDGVARISLMDDGKVVTDPEFTKSLTFIRVRGIIDPLFSDFTASVPDIFDDGTSAVTFTLTAIDNLSAPVRGLRDIVFDVNTPGLVEQSGVAESSAGVYVQTFVSRSVGNYTVTPDKSLVPIAGLTPLNLEVRVAPYIDMSTSSFTPDAVQLIADGTTVKALTLTLIDQYGQPFDMSGITLNVENMPGVTISAPVQVTPGTVRYDVTAVTPFKADGTITLQNKGRDIDARMVLAFHVDPVHGKIDGALSSLFVVPDTIDANGFTTTRIIFEAKDGYGTRASGQASDLSFAAKDISTGVTIGNIVESSTGNYEATLTSRTPGTTHITASHSGIVIAGLNTPTLTLNDVSGIPYMANCSFSSTLVGNPGNIYDQENQTFDLEFWLKDALGDPIGGQNVTFNSNNSDVVLSQTFEYQAGVYTVTVSAKSVASITLTPSINGGTYPGAPTYTFLVMASPELDATYSELTISPHSVIADSSTPVTVTYHAKDQYGQSFPGLSGLTLDVTRLAGTLIGGAFVDNNDGTYSTTLRSGQVGTASVGIKQNGTLLATPRVDIPFTPVPGVIDPAKCSFDVTPDHIDGNGTDIATVTFRAVDGLGDDIPGLKDIKFTMQGMTDSDGNTARFAVASGEATESTPAHYTATITSLGGATGTIWVYNGSTRVDALEATLRVRDMRGILNGGHSTLTVVKPSIQAMMAERVFTPADSSDYVTEVTFQAEDQFNQPITGIQFGDNKALLFVETSGTVPIEVDYRGESTTTPGTYHAYVRTSTPGTAIIDVQYNNQLLTGVPGVPLTVTAAPTIDWDASVLIPELPVVENNTRSLVTLTFTPVDTNGELVTGLQSKDLDIELQTGSLTAADQTLTGLGSLTPFVTVSDGVYRVNVTLTGNEIADQLDPVYVLNWKGTQQATPTATFSLQPQHDVLNLAHSIFEVTNDEILDDPLATGYVPVYVKFKPRDWYDTPIQALTLSEVEFVPTGPAGAQFGAMTRTVEASGDVVFQAELRTTTAGEVDIALWLKGVEVTQAKYQLDVESIEPVYTPLDPGYSTLFVVPDLIQIGYDTYFSASLLAYDDQVSDLVNIRNLSLKVTPPIVTFDPLEEDSMMPGTYNTSLYVGNQSGTFTVEVLQGGVPTGIVSTPVTIHPAEKMAGAASTWTVTPAFVYAEDLAGHIDVEFHGVAADGTPAADSLHMEITSDDPVAEYGLITETSPGTYSRQITWKQALTRGKLTITATQAGVKVGSTQIEVRAYPTVDGAKSQITIDPAGDKPLVGDADQLHVVLRLRDASDAAITGLLNLIELTHASFTGLTLKSSNEDAAEPGTYHFYFKSTTPGKGTMGVKFNNATVTGLSTAFQFLDVYGFDPALSQIRIIDAETFGVTNSGPANHKYLVRFELTDPDNTGYDLSTHTVAFQETSGNLTLGTKTFKSTYASVEVTAKDMGIATLSTITVTVDGHAVTGVNATLSLTAVHAADLLHHAGLSRSKDNTWHVPTAAVSVANDGTTVAYVRAQLFSDGKGTPLDYSKIQALGSTMGFADAGGELDYSAITISGNALTVEVKPKIRGIAGSYFIYPTLDGAGYGTGQAEISFTATSYVKDLYAGSNSSLTGSVESLTATQSTGTLLMKSYETAYVTLTLRDALLRAWNIDLSKHAVLIQMGVAGLMTVSNQVNGIDKVTFQIRCINPQSTSFIQTLTVKIDGFQLSLKLVLNISHAINPANLASGDFGMYRTGDPYISQRLVGLKATETVNFQFTAPPGTVDFAADSKNIDIVDDQGALTFTLLGTPTASVISFSAVAKENVDVLGSKVYLTVFGARVPTPYLTVQMAKDDPFAGKSLGRTVTATVNGTTIIERAKTASGGKLVVKFDPSLAGLTGVDMSKFNMKIADSRGILSDVQTVNHGSYLDLTLAAIPAGCYTTTIYVTKDGESIGRFTKFDLLVLDNEADHASSFMSGVTVAPVAAVNKSISIQYVMRDDQGKGITAAGVAPAIYTAPYGGVTDKTAINAGATNGANIWLAQTTTGRIAGNDYRVGWKINGRLATDPFVMPRLRLISVVPTRHLTNFGSVTYDDRNVYLSFMHDGAVYAGEEYILALQAMSVNSVATDPAFRDSTQVKLVEANGKAFTWSIVPENEMPKDSFSALFRVRFPSATEEYNIAVTIAGKSHPTSELKIKPAGMSYGLNPAASSISINGKKKVKLAAGMTFNVTLELIGTSLGTSNLVLKDSLGIITFNGASKIGNVFTIRALVKADAVLGEETHIYPVYGGSVDLKSLNVRVIIVSKATAAETPVSYCHWDAKVTPGTTSAYGQAIAPSNGSVAMTFNKFGRSKNATMASYFNPEKKTLTFKEANNQLSLKTGTDNTYSTSITATPSNPAGGAYTRVYPVIDGVEYPGNSFCVVFKPTNNLDGYFKKAGCKVTASNVDWPGNYTRPIASGSKLTFKIGLGNGAGGYAKGLAPFVKVVDSAGIMTFAAPTEETSTGMLVVTATVKDVSATTMTEIVPMFLYPNLTVISEVVRAVKVKSPSGAFDDYEPVFSGEATLNLISVAQSSFTTSKTVLAGDGEELELTFVARDADGNALPGLVLAFRSSNPLLDIADVVDHGFGTYTATAHAHSFDYATTVEVVNGGTATGIKQIIDVQPQQQPQPLILEPLISARSPNSLKPSVAPCDGKTAMVATLNLLEHTGEPLAGADVVLVAMDGSTDVTVGEVEETAPGVYAAPVTSRTKGPVILGWYANGMYISGKRGGFHSIAPAEPVAEHPPIQVRAAAAPAPVNIPTYIEVVAATVGPEDEIALEADDLMVIYPDDGDASTNRQISIERDPTYGDKWILSVMEINALGISSLSEMVRFSLDPNDTDYAGLPAWLPYQLEKTSSRLRAVVRTGAVMPSTFTGVQEMAFVGGSEGTLANITAEDYRKALQALEASTVNYTAMLGLGIYDESVLRLLAQHAYDRRIDMFCDAPPTADPVNAMMFTAGLGFGAYPHVAVYHFPYSSRDIYTGTQVTFGLSGDVFTAKARGVAQVPNIGGWHYSPAGMARGSIMRRSITPLAAAEGIDREEYVRMRLNTVAPAVDGNMQIDDSLTTYLHQDGQQYQHVSSVLNALARDINDICTVIRHEPGNEPEIDLQRELALLFEDYARAGALVPPRDPDQGSYAYDFNVVNTDFDTWLVQYAVCVVGTARRITCEPIVYR